MDWETKKIWLDGKMIRWADAKIHVMSHGLHYGTGVFEGLRCYQTEKGRVIFRVQDHIDRFFLGMKALGMDVKFSKSDIQKAIFRIVKENQLGDCYIRPFAFYGYGKVGVYPKEVPSHLCVLAMPFKNYLGIQPIHVKTPPFHRIAANAMVPGTKLAGMYYNAVLAAMWSRQHGADEALMLDSQGNVSEGASMNFFMVKKVGNRPILITPKSPDLLPGFTRDTVLAMAKDLGLSTRIQKVTLKDVYHADEAFFTGTAVEVHPIGKVNGKKIGTGMIGPVTQKVAVYYKALARGEFPQYKKWLTYL